MTSAGREGWIRKSLRVLLRPLVRFLIAERIGFPVVSDMLKQLYVEVADREFALDERENTASRVSLLTGLYRREIQRLRNAENDEPESSASVSLGARLIAEWSANPRFTDPFGRPLPLSRSGRRVGPSIRELIETSRADVRAQAVLDEWLRLGVVELRGDGRIYLRQDSFVAEEAIEEKAAFFGRILRAHIATGTHNLTGDGDPMLDQVVYYGGLRPESAEFLRGRARALALVALRTWNREARELQEGDRGRDDARERVHFGAYVYAETVADDDELSPEPES